MNATGSNLPMPVSVSAPKLLLVEGPDDYRFFTALVRHLEISDIQILSYRGKDKLRPYLGVLPSVSGFDFVTAIGVTRDADSHAGNTFTSVRDALTAAQLPAPREPLIATSSLPRVIVAIIPPGQSQGELEDLCLQSISGDPALPCVDRYFECLDASTDLMPRPLSKAKVHTFLASRNIPNRRLGEAADAGDWPWVSSAFDELKLMISQL